MFPVLFSLGGAVALRSFSVALALGLALFIYVTLKHPWRKLYITKELFINGVSETAIAGIIGARLLHVASEWHNYTSLGQVLSIWNGGLSILGAVIGIAAYSIWYILRHNLPLLPLLDLACLYAPLVHAIARIGCLLAGCCYGCVTQVPWAITYTNPETVAPLHVALHPTQVYSSVLFMLLFFLLHRLSKKAGLYKHGLLTGVYLLGLSLERLVVDFFRGDRIINSSASIIKTELLSFHQWLAVGLGLIALTGLVLVVIRSRYERI